jgi:hypothetical protein
MQTQGRKLLKGIELNLLSFLHFIDVSNFMCVRCLGLCHVMVVLCQKVCGLFQLVHLNPFLLQCSWNKLWPPKAALLKHITLSKISSIKNLMQNICLETHQVLRYYKGWFAWKLNIKIHHVQYLFVLFLSNFLWFRSLLKRFNLVKLYRPIHLNIKHRKVP